MLVIIIMIIVIIEMIIKLLLMMSVLVLKVSFWLSLVELLKQSNGFSKRSTSIQMILKRSSTAPMLSGHLRTPFNPHSFIYHLFGMIMMMMILSCS